MDFLPCIWAGPERGATRQCKSQKMAVRGAMVKAATCAGCSLRNHPPLEPKQAKARPTAAKHPLPCIHLGEPIGETVECQSCNGTVKLKLFACAVHGKCTTAKKVDAYAACPGCKDYSASPAKERPRLTKRQAEEKKAFIKAVSEPAKKEPKCGIVVGCFSQWPELIELQIKTIRKSCGKETPILISEDAGPHRSEVVSLCRRYDVDFIDTGRVYPEQQLVERIGHTGGDMGTMFQGLLWAHRNGFEVLAKLSQRFIVTKDNWLKDGARDFLESGLGLASQECTGIQRYPLRTECMLLLVRAWASNPLAMQALLPRPRQKPENAEIAIDRIYRDYVCSIIFPWELFGEERTEPGNGYLWHYGDGPDAYRDLAESFGIEWTPEFSCYGWNAIDSPYVY